MRNLRNIQRAVASFADFDVPLTATTWDASNDSLICAFGPSAQVPAIELRRLKNPGGAASDEKHTLITSWDAPSPNPDLDVDKVLSLHYFADTAVICLVLAGGDIIVVREEPLPGQDAIEIVGSVDAGISAAVWSPDEELLAISTKADTLLYMTRDFENITSIQFAPEDVKASNHVSVGWGKSETQFKGKRAKALRDPTMPEKTDEGLLSPHDDGRVTMSWRGDGSYLAVNSVESGKRRMIRVYSRDGVLDSVSEPVDHLEAALSWRPAGNLIAGVQRHKDRLEVVFFERNGLRHGEFNLRLKPFELDSFATTVDLKWNVDSTVLAVCFKDRVQLWTMGNYHYYLKQEILEVDQEDPTLTARLSSGENVGSMVVCWHPEKALRLCLQNKVTTQMLEYIFTVARDSASPPNDFGAVAVIDGKTLKFTPLRSTNIPPPMAYADVELHGNAIDVCISSNGTHLAVLLENEVALYALHARSKPPLPPSLIKTISISRQTHIVPRQVALGKIEEPFPHVFVLFHCITDDSDAIYCIAMDQSEQWNAPRCITPPMDMLGFSSCSDADFLLFQGRDGTVHTLSYTKESYTVETLTKLPASAPWTEVAPVSGEGIGHIVIGLTISGGLYANGRQLVRNCTSFVVTPAHLIFTTTQHLLKFVHLVSVQDLEIPLDEPEKDERCRSIERGARLVTVMPTTYAVVLQMPRGNLETIYPRALVLAGIRRSIGSKKYRTAFLACRNQRVDMNILHDHDPVQFMASVGLIVNQLKKIEYIDLFLSQLREEDVSQTMYRETLKICKPTPNGVSNTTENKDQTKAISTPQATLGNESKVNRICNAFLEVLTDRTATNMQNIITANVCKSPPDLEGGLRVVAELRRQGDDLAEKAAEHICFLADVNQLYDHALGLYDLELTTLIAQQSQKDPREYLPYLQSLQELPQLRQQFTIDDHLGRQDKALNHLHTLNVPSEFQSYVVKHELYTTALRLSKYSQSDVDAIMKLYADFLNSRNRFQESGIAYEYLSDYPSATSAYQAANTWRSCLATAALIPLPPTDLSSLANTLADGLIESKDFQAAATIHLDYLSDVETAARFLCRGYFFSEAMRIIALQRKPELLSSVVDVGLGDGVASMTELLADCKSQLLAQIPRLRELREKKERDPLAFYAGDAEAAAGVDFPDNISLAPTDATTSGGTFMTRYTGRTSSTIATGTTRKTSKGRRREERKRARGKKGSVYEEEYLVNSIARLIERVNSVSDEVARLVEGCVRRRMRERARAVEELMGEVVGGCKACVEEVFPAAAKKEEDVEGDGERPTGGDAVLWETLEGRGILREAPIIKAFERMSLT